MDLGDNEEEAVLERVEVVDILTDGRFMMSGFDLFEKVVKLKLRIIEGECGGDKLNDLFERLQGHSFQLI
jgi:hypothetical protein